MAMYRNTWGVETLQAPCLVGVTSILHAYLPATDERLFHPYTCR